MKCPQCDHDMFINRKKVDQPRGCLIWGIAILFFPIGLLAFLVPPRQKDVRVRTCKNCGFEEEID